VDLERRPLRFVSTNVELLTSPKSGGPSVGIVHLRSRATESLFIIIIIWMCSLSLCVINISLLSTAETGSLMISASHTAHKHINSFHIVVVFVS
jgi:hypothetical protein